MKQGAWLNRSICSFVRDRWVDIIVITAFILMLLAVAVIACRMLGWTSDDIRHGAWWLAANLLVAIKESLDALLRGPHH